LALSSQGDLADSKVEFDEALKYASDKWARARTLTHRGVASERSGLYQEARKDAESALKEWPGYRPAEALIARLNKKR
ncbi:MAG TPA: hypothetical protein VFM21_03175, partial [Terriglobia bacterium]|nr:hypothetical protein [Terriglobia bacterium]